MFVATNGKWIWITLIYIYHIIYICYIYMIWYIYKIYIYIIYRYCIYIHSTNQKWINMIEFWASTMGWYIYIYISYIYINIISNIYTHHIYIYKYHIILYHIYIYHIYHIYIYPLISHIPMISRPKRRRWIFCGTAQGEPQGTPWSSSRRGAVTGHRRNMADLKPKYGHL